MKIITGRTGTNHINSSDDGEMNAAVIGNGDYVLDAGSKFSANIVNNNTIQIGDGELLMQGRHGRIVANSSDTVTIENGAQGVARTDLIVCEYSRTGDVENMSLKVLKGTPGTDTPPVPTVGNLRNGDNLHQMALYEVHLNGLVIESLYQRYTVMPGIASLDEKISQMVAAAILEDNKKKYHIGKIIMSTQNVNPSEYLGFGTWVLWGEGRVPVGVKTSETEFSSVEKTGGEKTHVLSSQEMPQHTHGLASHTHGLGSHKHTVPGHAHTANQKYVVDGWGVTGFAKEGTPEDLTVHTMFGSTSPGTAITQLSGGCTTGEASGTTDGANGSTASTGSGVSHNNLQPYITCYMFKRTK